VLPKLGKCLIYCIIFLLLLISGCYSPSKVVQYQPEDIIKGAKGDQQDKIPPKIVITSPKSTSTRGVAVVGVGQKVAIEGYVIDNGPIESFTIDGENVPLSHDGRFSHRVKAAQKINRFALIAVDQAYNRTKKTITLMGSKSTPGKAKAIPWPLPPTTASSKPTLWILAVGVSNYQNPALNLKYADNDALALARTIKKEEGGIFSEVFIKTLVNAQATRGNILTAMTTHLGKAGPNDVVFIFVAGHGRKMIQTGSYYFLPHDADSQNLIFQGLKWSDFDEAIKILSQTVNKIVLVLDTCYSGAINVAMRDLSLGEDLAATMQASTGCFILSAAKSGETSMEDSSLKLTGELKGHGAFTYALLKGLNGEANYDKNSYLTIGELFSYVAAQVPRITKGQQHPYSKIEGTDLPIISFK
jgi:hypothetical protein